MWLWRSPLSGSNAESGLWNTSSSCYSRKWTRESTLSGLVFWHLHNQLWVRRLFYWLWSFMTMISRLTLWHRPIIGPIRITQRIFVYISFVLESSLWDHVVVWRSASALASFNEVNLRQARLVLGWWPCPGSISIAGNLSLYVTSHPGQLSLPSLRGW